jgi:hypothetical protein
MRILLQIISAIALAMTVLPSLVYFSGSVKLETVKWIMIVASVVWFAVTPFWMDKKEQS